jgi:hypothetical protein
LSLASPVVSPVPELAPAALASVPEAVSAPAVSEALVLLSMTPAFPSELGVTVPVAAPSIMVSPERVSSDALVSEAMLRTSGSARRELPFAAAVPTPVSSGGGETTTGMMGVLTLPGERMTSFGGEASLEVCPVAMLAAPSAQASRLSLIVEFIITPFAERFVARIAASFFESDGTCLLPNASRKSQL